MKNTTTKTVIVTPDDLVITSMGKENVTINDFSGMVKKAARTADLVIYVDESKVKIILVFNNNLIEEPIEYAM